MTKNLMPEVLKLLGVEYGEKFKLRENGEEKLRDGVYCFVEDLGFIHIVLDRKKYHANELLEELLIGYYEIVKLPWKPKYGDTYYYPNINKKRTSSTYWSDITGDYAMKALGMVYRTKEEAEKHLAEDYERLTGKKLEE